MMSERRITPFSVFILTVITLMQVVVTLKVLLKSDSGVTSLSILILFGLAIVGVTSFILLVLIFFVSYTETVEHRERMRLGIKNVKALREGYGSDDRVS